jgi:hypothetical protein
MVSGEGWRGILLILGKVPDRKRSPDGARRNPGKQVMSRIPGYQVIK